MTVALIGAKRRHVLVTRENSQAKVLRPALLARQMRRS
jgi:hypothetical protein